MRPVVDNSNLAGDEFWRDRIRLVYDGYLVQLLAGNRNDCGRVVSQLLEEGIPIRTLYLELMQRSLYEVGELWERNRISVVRQHGATHVTEYLLALAYPRISFAKPSGRTVVVACIADEYHQVGAKMVADILELNRWRVHYLGANTSVSDLLSLLEESSPDLLAISLSLSQNLHSLLASLALVRGAHPALPIIVGGQAFRHGGSDSLAIVPLVTFLESIDHLEEYLQRFSGGGGQENSLRYETGDEP